MSQVKTRNILHLAKAGDCIFQGRQVHVLSCFLGLHLGYNPPQILLAGLLLSSAASAHSCILPSVWWEAPQESPGAGREKGWEKGGGRECDYINFHSRGIRLHHCTQLGAHSFIPDAGKFPIETSGRPVCARTAESGVLWSQN